MMSKNGNEHTKIVTYERKFLFDDKFSSLVLRWMCAMKECECVCDCMQLRETKDEYFLSVSEQETMKRNKSE